MQHYEFVVDHYFVTSILIDSAFLTLDNIRN